MTQQQLALQSFQEVQRLFPRIDEVYAASAKLTYVKEVNAARQNLVNNTRYLRELGPSSSVFSAINNTGTQLANRIRQYIEVLEAQMERARTLPKPDRTFANHRNALLLESLKDDAWILSYLQKTSGVKTPVNQLLADVRTDATATTINLISRLVAGVDTARAAKARAVQTQAKATETYRDVKALLPEMKSLIERGSPYMHTAGMAAVVNRLRQRFDEVSASGSDAALWKATNNWNGALLARVREQMQQVEERLRSIEKAHQEVTRLIGEAERALVRAASYESVYAPLDGAVAQLRSAVETDSRGVTGQYDAAFYKTWIKATNDHVEQARRISTDRERVRLEEARERLLPVIERAKRVLVEVNGQASPTNALRNLASQLQQAVTMDTPLPTTQYSEIWYEDVLRAIAAELADIRSRQQQSNVVIAYIDELNGVKVELGRFRNSPILRSESRIVQRIATMVVAIDEEIQRARRIVAAL